MAPKEDRNKKPGRVGGTGGALQLADQADDEGHLGGGIDQSAGSLAPALDNSCPAENPSQLLKSLPSNRWHQAKYPPKTEVKRSSLPSHVYNELAYGLYSNLRKKR